MMQFCANYTNVSFDMYEARHISPRFQLNFNVMDKKFIERMYALV